ncbi:protein suppressor of hairy wing-like isoform X2 [Teleopsis dalmanni]|uniref:protein suppressor of hairy wing-like isoform X2 n=1 Tax=Teleopsis dalmanni TaxID=139649 RepID=UPI0018CD1935|nr:protein suppressor of hairy wing-like isoform X2 [Teleopsis dalmanni]
MPYKRCCIMKCPMGETDLHVFPCAEKDKERRQQWMRIFGLKTLPKYAYACNRHFSDSMKTAKHLKKKSFPDQNLEKYSSFTQMASINKTLVASTDNKVCSTCCEEPPVDEINSIDTMEDIDILKENLKLQEKEIQYLKLEKERLIKKLKIIYKMQKGMANEEERPSTMFNAFNETTHINCYEKFTGNGLINSSVCVTKKDHDKSITKCCALVEVTSDKKVYSIRCISCTEEFPIWNWQIFMEHEKEKHSRQVIEEAHYSINPKSNNQTKENPNIIESDSTEDGNSVNQNKENPNIIVQHKIEVQNIIEYPLTSDNDNSNNNDAHNYISLDLNYISEEEQILKDSQNIEPKSKQCRGCLQRFKSLSLLRRHRFFCKNKSKKVACHLCGKYFSRVYILTHIKLHEQPQFKCNECPKKFYLKYVYEEHVKTHNKVFHHVCEYCGKVSKTAKAMAEHRKYAHLKVCKCDICDLKLSSLSAINRHKKFMHLALEGTNDELEDRLKNKKYPKVFDTKTKKNRYVCDVCSNTYASCSALLSHRRNLHSLKPSGLKILKKTNYKKHAIKDDTTEQMKEENKTFNNILNLLNILD